MLAAESEALKGAWVSKLNAAAEALADHMPTDDAVWVGISRRHGKSKQATRHAGPDADDDPEVEMENMLFGGADIELTGARTTLTPSLLGSGELATFVYDGAQADGGGAAAPGAGSYGLYREGGRISFHGGATPRQQTAPPVGGSSSGHVVAAERNLAIGTARQLPSVQQVAGSGSSTGVVGSRHTAAGALPVSATVAAAPQPEPEPAPSRTATQPPASPSDAEVAPASAAPPPSQASVPASTSAPSREKSSALTRFKLIVCANEVVVAQAAVRVAASSMAQLQRMLISKLGLDSDAGDIYVCTWDEDFEEFIDGVAFGDIPTKCRVQLRRRNSSARPPPSPPPSPAPDAGQSQEPASNEASIEGGVATVANPPRKVRFAQRRRSLSQNDLGAFIEEPQPEPEPPTELEPQPEPDPEQSHDAAADAATEGSRQLSLDQLLSDAAFDYRTDRVALEGWLRIVEEAPWRSALRSKNTQRRKRRASITAGVSGVTPFWVVLQGTRIVWFSGPDRAEMQGSVKLDPGSKVGIHPELDKVALLEVGAGWVISSTTQKELNEWVMAISFNCHAALRSVDKDWGEALNAIADAPRPSAEQCLTDTHWHSNGGRGSDWRFDAAFNHPSREGRLSFAIEVMQGKPPADVEAADTPAGGGDAGTASKKLYDALASEEPLHAKMLLGLPPHVSKELDRDRARETLRESKRNLRASAIDRVRTYWTPMMQTEERVPVEVSPRRHAISFVVMPSADTEITVADGVSSVSVSAESVRVRFDLCDSKGTILGSMACGLTELQEALGGRMVAPMSYDSGEQSERSFRSQSAQSTDAFQEAVGVQIGISVYRLAAQPTEGAMHTVCMQSYLLPVQPLIARGNLRPTQFDERALRSPTESNAVIVSEHLALPRASIDVPAAYLQRQTVALRDRLRKSLAEVRFSNSVAL